MKTKIIGLGKCGSRLTYDFFAYISSTPTAYDIRLQPNSKFLSYLMDKYPLIAKLRLKLQESKIERLKLIQEMFGVFLIFDPVELVIVDSDNDNNEITNWITYINRQGTSLLFPGRFFSLAGHEGGCDFHIISENLCIGWSNIDEEIVSNHIGKDDADIVSVVFSLGGGTGGGSAPIISYKCKQYARKYAKSSTKQTHFMGIGVLPMSVETYHDEELVPYVSPNESETYNTGRFFVNLYGRRKQHQKNPSEDTEPHMDSVWLFSNDCLRLIRQKTSESLEDSKLLEDPNLSLINQYIAASLTVICNASSPYTKSEPNFDAIEMNSKLNGYPFISGYSFLTPEKSGDRNLHSQSIKDLLKLALNNPTISSSSRLVGLSVPVEESELKEVNQILRETDYSRSQTDLASYDINKAPLEFRTASRVIVIYGQNVNNHSPFKDGWVRDIVSTLFKNSYVESYYYQHPGKDDELLILIVNPFIRLVQNSMFYYTDISWMKEDVEDGFYDDLVITKPFSQEELDNRLMDEEQILDEFHGQKIIELVKKFKNPSRVSKQQVIDSFHHLNDMFHYKKKGPRRTSKI